MIARTKALGKNIKKLRNIIIYKYFYNVLLISSRVIIGL